MKITSLRQYKGTTYEAELDDDRKIYLHIDIVTDFGLYCGMELERDTLRKIIYASNFRRAYQYALYSLDYRDYSYSEMYKKLEKTYKNEKLCFAVMERLVKFSFINDRRYAEKLARKYVETKRFGLRRAKTEMYAKGLPSDIIDEALEEFEGLTEENLAYLLEKKYARLLEDRDDRKTIEKVKSALVRYGYGFSDINRAVADYFESTDSQEDI